MADTSVKLSGTYDSIEAYNMLVEMQNMSADYEEIRTEAAAAASAATAASAAATNAVNTANAAVSDAQTYAGNANTAAGEAAGYASDASTAATNAASSETNASNSASAAATSATNAAASEAVVAGALPLSGGTITGDLAVTGALTKGGKSVEAVNASGSNHIRFESGLQVCWGYTTANTSGTTVTFGASFKDASSYRIVGMGHGASIGVGVSNITASSVKILSSSASVAAAINWIAVGWWK